MRKIYFLLLLLTNIAFAQPPIGNPANILLCDFNNDGMEVVDLTVNTPTILGALNPGLYTLNYFNSLAAAQGNTSPITNPNLFTANGGQMVYARVEENANTTNFSTTSFTIQFQSTPTATITTASQTVCMDGGISVDFQGTGGIAPYIFTYSIDGGVNQTIVSDMSGLATIFLPQIAGQQVVSLVYVSASGVLACGQNLSEVVTINAVPFPNPSTPPDLYVVDNPYDGVASFNLTLNTPGLMNGDPNMNVTYYTSLADAELGTLSIISPSNYTASSGQVIWARIENTAAVNCFDARSFRLFVSDPNAPNNYINIPDPIFKSALITIGVDTNNDGQIQYTEATVPTQLAFAGLGITDITGINFFTSLSSVNFNYNQIGGSIDISNLVNLTSFECNDNHIAGIALPASANLTQLFCANNQITSLNLTGTTNLQTLYCVNNLISSLTLVPSLRTVSCGQNNLTSLNLNTLTNLQYFACQNSSSLTSLTATGLTNLLTIICNNNPALLSVDVSGCTGLNDVSTDGNTAMTSLNVSGCTGLDYLVCFNSQLTTLDASNLPTLQSIKCGNNQLTSLNITGCPALKELQADTNLLTAVDFSGSPLLEVLLLGNNQFTTLTVTNKPNLSGFSCVNNPGLTSLNVSGCSFLSGLYLYGVPLLANLNVSGCTSMIALQCSQTALTTLDVSGLTGLLNLQCQNNQLTTLNLTNCPTLQYLSCHANQLTTLDVSGSPLMINLNCSENDLSSLDVSNLTALQQLSCAANQLTTLDVTNSPNLFQLDCSVNDLTTLFVKNGANESVSLQLNPNLVYVCADETQISTLTTLAGPTVQVNSYCSFTPGGNYNTITGNLTFDGNGNGCGPDDAVQPFIKVTIDDGATTGATFSNATANYSFYTGAGNYTLAPELENQTWFTISPNNPVINFPNANNNITTQNFCIVANGIHPDVEVVIAPVMPARPGFNAEYKIVYKNKGNQTLSGAVNMAFDDTVLNFISATVVPSAQSTGSLNWSYSNLAPFENRSFNVTLHVNAPTDTPAVNIGHILPFTVTITPIAGDDSPGDNTFQYSQTVVGAYDPNDITCLQGDLVSPSTIGQYLHYIINFENTGNFQAENIVVKDTVDLTKYDLSSLQILNSSAPVTARIKNNVVEFIFQNINLDSGGHGNILLKMKSKNTLVQGDMVSKMANIYFDYNFPIQTNDAETTFQSLSNPDFETDASVTVYPNPTKGMIQIQSDFNIQSVQLYDVQGRLLQVQLVLANNTIFDISTHSSGVYFVKIITDKGMKVQQMIKQ